MDRLSENEYWDWVVISVFLLIPLDMLTTSFALSRYSIENELNPFMRLILQQEWYIVLIVNLGISLIAIGLFYGVLEMLQLTPEPYQAKYSVLIEIWIGGLLTLGLFILANNLSAIFLGQSLL